MRVTFLDVCLSEEARAIALLDICSTFTTYESFYSSKVNVTYILLCKGAWKIILTINSRYCELQNLYSNSWRNHPAILQLMIGLKRVLKAQT